MSTWGQVAAQVVELQTKAMAAIVSLSDGFGPYGVANIRIDARHWSVRQKKETIP